uniref:Uncharacterized protein n=1 Tax=Arundo donax TaxID=35708 RepID=A0A0A9DNC0_ARUDO
MLLFFYSHLSVLIHHEMLFDAVRTEQKASFAYEVLKAPALAKECFGVSI